MILKIMARKKIILIGARLDGHAGVILDIIKDYALYDPVGFIDDNLAIQNTLVGGLPVLGTIESFLSRVDFEGVYFIASGDNGFREKIYTILTKRGLRLGNIIHPSAVISSSVELGEGIFIGPKVVITHNARIGNGVIINTAATIDHDNLIGEFVNMSPGCHTSGRVIIGKRVFLGTGVVLLPDIVLEDDVVIGAGAVVTKRVAKNTTVVGVPAKPIIRLEKK